MMIKTLEHIISPSIEEKWHRVVNLVSHILEVPAVLITRVKPPEIEVFSSSQGENNPYKAGDVVKLAKLYCEDVCKTKIPLEVNNALKSKRWKDAPEIKDGLISYLGYPLLWPTGEVFGTICALDSKENVFGSLYHEVLQEFAGIVEHYLNLVVSKHEVEEKNKALEKALDEVQNLRKLIPICSKCHKIKVTEDYWQKLESYFAQHSDIRFSHGYCNECADEILKDLENS